MDSEEEEADEDPNEKPDMVSLSLSPASGGSVLMIGGFSEGKAVSQQ